MSNIENQLYPKSKFEFVNPLDQLETGLDLIRCAYEGLDAEQYPGQVKTLEVGLQLLTDAHENLMAARYIPGKGEAT